MPEVTLRDGSVIAIRQIRPEDRDALREGFERLSPEARYRRFFAPVRELSDRQLDYLTQIDHHDHEALIALVPEQDAVIGVARFVRMGPGVAEPAMVVADDWQGRGLATLLLDRLVQRSFDEGITRWVAPVLAHNREAVHVLARLGETAKSTSGSEVELVIDLTTPERVAAQLPADHPLRAALRAIGAGTIEPAVSLWHRLVPRRRPGRDEWENEIVIVVDPDDTGDLAVRAGLALARARGACVHLVSAYRPLLDDRSVLDVQLRRAAERLENAGVETAAHVRLGDLAAVALDVAGEERARLLVVADTTEEPDTGRLLGRPWDHVTHHSPCDVLIARPSRSGVPH